MENLTRLEKEVIELPVRERERLVSLVLESLGDSFDYDSDNIKIALERDKEIENGKVQSVSHEVFMKKTNIR